MNDKSDIPDGEGLDVEKTNLDLPDLPGDWSWVSVNHIEGWGKVNLYFGLNQEKTGGHLGEIDNYMDDGEERWTLHVRPIIAIADGNRPRGTAETSEEYDSFNEAIEAVPDHVATHYEVDA